MHSLGFLLKDIDVSQLTYYLIKNIAALLSDRSDLDVIVFQQSLIRPAMKAPFAILHERELWSYGGVALTSTIDLARNLLEVPQCKRKVFYVTDVEWTTRTDFETMHRIYTQLDLVAENQQLFDILKIYWKEPLGVAENFNIRKILEILKI
jgi:hypothetical protein